MTIEAEHAADLIKHFGIGSRASIATVLNGTGYFAVTPEAPYDSRLSTADQTRQLLCKAEARLARIGSGKDRLAFVAIILVDMKDYQAVNAVWDEWVKDIVPPARVCLEARLASPDLKVEMIMVSAVP
ncbi:Rid family hydrolase [Microvirga sp. GCM10011540]|uniref:Rid family hydrolase n=1 Tax=Microvirga sp. GCM10011540 TaxID=3317338 RepID=UPI00360E8B8B